MVGAASWPLPSVEKGRGRQPSLDFPTRTLTRLLSVKRSTAPILPLASTLQLALNLLQFCYVVRRESDLTGGDREQHLNQCVSRDGYQLSEHPAPLWERSEYRYFLFAIALPDVPARKSMKLEAFCYSRCESCPHIGNHDLDRS